MKILDYITFCSLNNQKYQERLNKIAKDTDADVFVAGQGSVIAIYESAKVSDMLNNKYSMHLFSELSSGFLEGAETKDELIEDYGNLVAAGVININSTSSNLKTILTNKLNQIKREQSANEKCL